MFLATLHICPEYDGRLLKDLTGHAASLRALHDYKKGLAYLRKALGQLLAIKCTREWPALLQQAEALSASWQDI